MSKAAKRQHFQAADEHQKELLSLIQSFGYKYRVSDIFGDFVEMSALAISNSVDLRQRDTRERRYLEIIQKYTPEEVERFPRMLGNLVLTYERRLATMSRDSPGDFVFDDGFDDVLGKTYMMLELGNDRSGQFFTPYPVSRMMAMMNLSGNDIADTGHDFVTVREPACGAGGMVIATAEALHLAGHNYQRAMHATCIDIDPRCVHMAYLQLSLLHIPAIVMLGNSLSLEQREVWFTPAHVLGGWSRKLAARRAQPVACATVPPPTGDAEMGTLAPDINLPTAGAAVRAQASPKLERSSDELKELLGQLSLF
ncbi:N-6 DNA methylase [Ralstonia nicotianae]|uniref:N-6 DNA methylase n=1 Tax=Ralstonia pseudosolanacearum TaxID=1310165 RepID=UPI002003BFF5|nr:N-6 DNA methylase [Ralstonia pseudosolanacearum]MCK4118365.1 N-6 DNA methylase [Ralstonia pseudosolanacearum]